MGLEIQPANIKFESQNDYAQLVDCAVETGDTWMQRGWPQD
jgi:hypothetical protein